MLEKLLKNCFGLQENYTEEEFWVAYSELIGIMWRLNTLGIIDTKETNEIIRKLDNIAYKNHTGVF